MPLATMTVSREQRDCSIVSSTLENGGMEMASPVGLAVR